MGQGGRDDVQVGGYGEPYGIFTRDGKPYPEHRMPFVRALEEQRVVVVDDLAIHRPDGTRVQVRAFARPVTADGAITHVVIAFFDVTREVEADRARAETEKRLHHAQRLEAVGTLAGGIAHDFNNLIFGIKLIAADLAADETHPERKASLALIDDITERSAMLTRSLLGFARRGKHRAMLFALDDVIEQMRELLTRTLVGVAISFELRATDRGAMVGDPSQLEQIVMNLVVNARDALHDTSGGHVVVRTYSTDRLVLEVIDDGPGIPAELRERVFEPYFTTKTYGAERGTGLGLATVFGIAAAHGGTVEVADGVDGVGTIIRVQLPAALEAAEPPRPPPQTRVPTGTGKVLVVDDDEMVLRGVGGALRALGYTTIEVTSGKQAIETYKRAHREIDAVLLDLMMPEMSGKATFIALREIDPSVAVLVMSGHTMNDDVEALFALGVRGFLTKPYSPDTLARSLADAIDRSPKP